MSKSYKLSGDNYIDAQGVTYNNNKLDGLIDSMIYGGVEKTATENPTLGPRLKYNDNNGELSLEWYTVNETINGDGNKSSTSVTIPKTTVEPSLHYEILSSQEINTTTNNIIQLSLYRKYDFLIISGYISSTSSTHYFNYDIMPQINNSSFYLPIIYVEGSQLYYYSTYITIKNISQGFSTMKQLAFNRPIGASMRVDKLIGEGTASIVGIGQSLSGIIIESIKGYYFE